MLLLWSRLRHSWLFDIEPDNCIVAVLNLVFWALLDVLFTSSLAFCCCLLIVEDGEGAMALLMTSCFLVVGTGLLADIAEGAVDDCC